MGRFRDKIFAMPARQDAPIARALMERKTDEIYSMAVLTAAASTEDGWPCLVVVHRTHPLWEKTETTAAPWARIDPDAFALPYNTKEGAEVLFGVDFIEGSVSITTSRERNVIAIAVLTGDVETVCEIEREKAETDIATARAQMRAVAKMKS